MNELMALLECLWYLAMQVVGSTVAQISRRILGCYLNSLNSVEFMEIKNCAS